MVKSKKVVKKAKKAPIVKKPSRLRSIFAPITGYFKGAWAELRQVRWPDRPATWSLTLAVILFSIFFLVLITLLDALFKFMFEIIIV